MVLGETWQFTMPASPLPRDITVSCALGGFAAATHSSVSHELRSCLPPLVLLGKFVGHLEVGVYSVLCTLHATMHYGSRNLYFDLLPATVGDDTVMMPATTMTSLFPFPFVVRSPASTVLVSFGLLLYN